MTASHGAAKHQVKSSQVSALKYSMYFSYFPLLCVHAVVLACEYNSVSLKDKTVDYKENTSAQTKQRQD